MTDVPEGFCQNLPAQPRVWDATRLRYAMQCWRKHWLGTVRGLRRNGAGSVHQEFGSFYHGAVERFDLALLRGTSREEATLAGLRWLVEATWPATTGKIEGVAVSVPYFNPWGGHAEECWQCTDPPMREHKRRPGVMVENKERCFWAKQASPLMPVARQSLGNGNYRPYCGEVHCGRDAVRTIRYLPDHPTKNRTSLFRAFMVYADAPERVELYQFEGETDCRGIGINPPPIPAVELLCRVPLPLVSPDDREPYELAALLDSLVLWEGELTIRERKTTGAWFSDRYWSQFDLDPQTDTYELLGWLLYASEQNNGMPIRVLMETMRVGRNDAELRRFPLPVVSEGRREEWLDQMQNIIQEAEDRAWMLREGTDPAIAFPRNTSACHGPYGDCPFIELCRADPADRERLIAENYHEERWNPLAKGESDG